MIEEKFLRKFWGGYLVWFGLFWVVVVVVGSFRSNFNVSFFF